MIADILALRVQELESPLAAKLLRTHCVVCEKATVGRKPWCPQHSGQSPYLQQVRAEVAKSMADRRKLRVDVGGVVCQDVLTYLRWDAMGAWVSGRRLAKDLAYSPKIKHGMPSSAFERHLRALQRAGLIEIRRGRRGLVARLKP